MQIIYISLGILAVAFVLFIVLFAFKKKLCQEKQSKPSVPKEEDPEYKPKDKKQS